jgi:hypothetical protein
MWVSSHTSAALRPHGWGTFAHGIAEPQPAAQQGRLLTRLTLPVGGLRLVEVVQGLAGEHHDLAAAPLPVVVRRHAVDICGRDSVELASADDRHVAAGAAVVSCKRVSGTQSVMWQRAGTNCRSSA